MNGNLVLSRRIGEAVFIGNDITVTVVGVTGNQVRLSFRVPKDVRVDREEIRQRILSEKRELSRQA